MLKHLFKKKFPFSFQIAGSIPPDKSVMGPVEVEAYHLDEAVRLAARVMSDLFPDMQKVEFIRCGHAYHMSLNPVRLVSVSDLG